MTKFSQSFRQSRVRCLSGLAVCLLFGGAYFAAAELSGPAVAGAGATPTHTTLLSGPSVSDGELVIHAATEAARRMVEMQTTGTTTAVQPLATQRP
jgi:hypothetical protein